MHRVSLSGAGKSIEDIWSWYEDQQEALRDFRTKIIKAFQNSSTDINEKFFALTLEEIQEYFDESTEELERLVAFNLISATEGILRVDFFSRVQEKDKSAIGREFRSIYKQKGSKISLEADIVENWKIHAAGYKSDFSSLLGLLHYRHWLAHGRYWLLRKRGRPYSVDEAYGIVEKIFDIVN